MLETSSENQPSTTCIKSSGGLTQESGFSHKNLLLFLAYITSRCVSPLHQIYFKIVRCNCGENCSTKTCTCCIIGLHCTQASGQCKGITCIMDHLLTYNKMRWNMRRIKLYYRYINKFVYRYLCNSL